MGIGEWLEICIFFRLSLRIRKKDSSHSVACLHMRECVCDDVCRCGQVRRYLSVGGNSEISLGNSTLLSPESFGIWSRWVYMDWDVCNVFWFLLRNIVLGGLGQVWSLSFNLHLRFFSPHMQFFSSGGFFCVLRFFSLGYVWGSRDIP